MAILFHALDQTGRAVIADTKFPLQEAGGRPALFRHDLQRLSVLRVLFIVDLDIAAATTAAISLAAVVERRLVGDRVDIFGARPGSSDR